MALYASSTTTTVIAMLLRIFMREWKNQCNWSFPRLYMQCEMKNAMATLMHRACRRSQGQKGHRWRRHAGHSNASSSTTKPTGMSTGIIIG